MVAVLMSNGWELDSRLFYIGNLLSVVPWRIFSVRVSRWTWWKLTDWFQRGHCHLLPKRHWSEQCAGAEYRNFRTEGILCLSPKTLNMWKHLRCDKVYRNLRHRTRCILDLAMIAKNDDKKLTELMMTYQVRESGSFKNSLNLLFLHRCVEQSCPQHAEFMLGLKKAQEKKYSSMHTLACSYVSQTPSKERGWHLRHRS